MPGTSLWNDISPDTLYKYGIEIIRSINCILTSIFGSGMTFTKMFNVLIKIQCKCIEIRNQKMKIEMKVNHFLHTFKIKQLTVKIN